MAIAVTPPPNDVQAGFSLLELLVVISIISVLAVGAVLTAASRGQDGAGDAARFVRDFDTQRGLALHGHAVRGLYVDPRGQQVALWEDGVWRAVGTRRDWRGRVSFQREGAGQNAVSSRTPEIVFLPSGQSTPFRVIFSGGSASQICRGDGWSALQCVAG